MEELQKHMSHYDIAEAEEIETVLRALLQNDDKAHVLQHIDNAHARASSFLSAPMPCNPLPMGSVYISSTCIAQARSFISQIGSVIARTYLQLRNIMLIATLNHFSGIESVNMQSDGTLRIRTGQTCQMFLSLKPAPLLSSGQIISVTIADKNHNDVSQTRICTCTVSQCSDTCFNISLLVSLTGTYWLSLSCGCSEVCHDVTCHVYGAFFFVDLP